MTDEVVKLIDARKAGELARFMKGFIKGARLRKVDAQNHLKEILISELERNGTNVRRKEPKVTH